MKKSLILGAVVLGIVLTQLVCFGEMTVKVTARTGKIRIIRPDGKVVTIARDKSIPPIPSGSKIRVLSGEVQLKVSLIKIKIEKKGIVQLWEDEKTGKINIGVDKKSKGEVKVTVFGNTIIVDPDEEIGVVVNKELGTGRVMVVKGEVLIGGKTIKAGEAKAVLAMKKEKEIVERKKPPVVEPEILELIPEPEEPSLEEASPSAP